VKATVVLVHGAFHGAWCWKLVQQGLAAAGVPVRALDLPGHGESAEGLGGLAEDAEAVRRALAVCGGPVVLCGHSYGGAVITEAAQEGGPVEHLVYLAAAVPDVGESMLDVIPEITGSLLASAVDFQGGETLVVDPEQATRIFYQDCDEASARWAVSQLGPEQSSSFVTPATRAPWRKLPATYVVCGDDAAISVAAQQRLAQRCPERVVWDTSHSPMLSQPDLLIALLGDLALRERS
jgi:pimeloyl-ACP methyl ester carboxylesterase